LNELGQKIPKTKLQLIAGIIWQLTRMLLDKIYIGKLISKLGLWFNQVKSMQNHKLCALFYYEMHKFSYLNMNSQYDFTPKTTIRETSYGTQSNQPSSLSLAHRTSYSYLTGFYYMLAIYNMTKMYTCFDAMSIRDELNLYEYHFSFLLLMKFLFPSKMAKWIINYFINHKFINNLTKPNSTVRVNEEIEKGDNKEMRKFKNLKVLLKKRLFIRFISEFESLTIQTFNNMQTSKADQQKQKLINLIAYKRKIFNSSYLYDSDDHFGATINPKQNPIDLDKSRINSVNTTIACDYVLSKFRDFLLTKMTNQIINESGMISVEKMLNYTSSSQSSSPTLQGSILNGYAGKEGENPCAIDDEEQKEMADVDQNKFESLISLYDLNSEYFSYSNPK
jgi:hypothetical protein